VVDVDVDLVGNLDGRLVSAETELAAEQEQENQHDNNQQNDGENSATTTAAGFHDGRALHFIAIIGHWKLSLSQLFYWRNERTLSLTVPQGFSMKYFMTITVLGALCACTPDQQRETGSNAVQPEVNLTEKTQVEPPASLPEPNGPIDPNSVEAAGQVVQSYGALIEQQRWPEANALWGSPAAAATLQTELVRLTEVHLTIGDLGEPEGAAGSIYVSMPVIFYGDAKDGQPFRRPADVILRRVNDVPGSTDAQRRWHIERIDWLGA